MTLVSPLSRMGKSHAEIQKAFRERQKAKGPEFLAKERLRVKQYWVPASQLNKQKLEERNRKAKLRNRLSRLRKQLAHTAWLRNKAIFLMNECSKNHKQTRVLTLLLIVKYNL